ncbi:MAG: hypothetical protein ABSF96_03370 [Steroidobacteraceae bacterium]|jgi:hypothetical protein
MVAKKTNRLRSARSRRQRTLQHQTLSPRTRHAIDTEAWFRGLLLERHRGSDSDRRWASKDQVHDEAITWFLQKHAQQPLSDYPARRTGDEDLTFWVDSKIMERVRRLALREGVKVARLIDAALSTYAREHVPEQLLSFRQRVQEEAARLYAALRGTLPVAPRSRRGSN